MTPSGSRSWSGRTPRSSGCSPEPALQLVRPLGQPRVRRGQLRDQRVALRELRVPLRQRRDQPLTLAPSLHQPSSPAGEVADHDGGTIGTATQTINGRAGQINSTRRSPRDRLNSYLGTPPTRTTTT